MREKFKLHWGTSYVSEGIGNNFGYWTHATTLKRYLDKNPNVEFTDKARDSIIITSPDFYDKKIPNKKNWLFTMFEGTTLPDIYIKIINKADYLLAPSSWVKNLFFKYFPNKQCFIVNHGVERDFRFRQRSIPKTIPFQYLWVGAPNPRKGYEPVILAWKHAGFINDPNVKLYIKTTSREPKGCIKKGNIIYDDRKICRWELVGLYRESHCFLMPSLGEGFCLVLAEAMRTGLPCIGTYYSGITDFFDQEVGYPLGYTMVEGKQSFFREGKEGEEYTTQLAKPRLRELVYWMHYVRYNYDEALKKGKKASERIINDFTWEKSAQTLIDAVNSTHKNK